MLYTIYFTNSTQSYVRVLVSSVNGQNAVAIAPNGFAPMLVQSGVKSVTVYDLDGGGIIQNFSINVTGSETFDVSGGNIPSYQQGRQPSPHMAGVTVSGNAI